MANMGSEATNITSYKIRGTENIIRVGDCVLMRSPNTRNPKTVARVEKFEKDSSNNVSVHVRLYYRPEDSTAKRRTFHGIKELFLSDRYDVKSADTIEGKCNVHTLIDYIKLQNKGANDFFCRFQYNVLTGDFTPNQIEVFCTCEMSYNPDIFMIRCTQCKERYHYNCLGMTLEHARSLNHYICAVCSPNNQEENEPTDSEEEGDENSYTDESTDEEDNGNEQEPSEVSTAVNPNPEQIVVMCGTENKAQKSHFSTQKSVNDSEMAVSSTRMVMNILNNMDGLESGSILWCKTLYLLEDPVRRILFLNMKNDSCRLAWINFRCRFVSD